MTRWAQAERHALADLFDEIGPDAPTLCTGWTTGDLAAHLVVRERRLDAAPGIVLRPLARYEERVRRHEAARPWSELVALVRDGPPRWSLTAIPSMDARVNTVEFYVHQEDVRRAQPGWAPRELDTNFEEALWQALRRSARLVCRRSPTGLVLASQKGEIVAKAGTPAARVEGAPGELVLFAYGRQAHALVDIVADVDTATELRATHLGI